jgi:curved DNA-binding protein CbpA
MQQTYYDLLKVSPDADDDVIAQAYLRLREERHPRNNVDDPLAEDIVRYLDAAFAVLIEPERRRSYDLELLNGHPPNGAVPVESAPAQAQPESVTAVTVVERRLGSIRRYFRRTFASLAIRDTGCC